MSNLKKDREILHSFTNLWTIDKIKSMSLFEYVGIRNKDTFCQWIETKTRTLGSINGLNSIKFGIYERGDKQKRPKNQTSDNEYSWQRGFNAQNRDEAFEIVKKYILQIIEAAIRGDFKTIDEIPLYSFYKWKIAFLYSNEGFIPIFERKSLESIASSLGMEISGKLKCSEMHIFIKNTYGGESVFDYMRELYAKYRGG